MKTSIIFIRRRFSTIICPIMGWRSEPFYKDGKPNHGAVQIERIYGARWRVVQLHEIGTGERTLSDALTKAELLAWMDSILVAARILRSEASNV